MKIVVTGSSGLLGGWLVHALRAHGDVVVPWALAHPLGDSEVVDLTDGATAAFALDRAAPDAVIHCAALSAMADCAEAPVHAKAINTQVPANLAQLCDRRRIRFVHVSTDLVFDGLAAPYSEASSPSPVSVYGRTKADAEPAVLAANGVVVRTSLLYGPSLTKRVGFFDQQLAALREGRALRLFIDEWRTPLALADAATGLRHIAHATDCTGTFHLGGPERMSRMEMGTRLAAAIASDSATFTEGRRDQAPGEPRPRDVSLDSNRYRARFPQHRFRSFEESAVAMLTARPAS